jgi:hypothetical protein
MTLPATCAQCTMHRPEGQCIRHAPGVTLTRNEIAVWTTTREDQRCGSGSTVDKPVKCSECIHWDTRVTHAPATPPQRSGFWAVKAIDKDWDSRHPCTRYAPSPGATEFATEWRMTHAEDACGDGVAITPSS